MPQNQPSPNEHLGISSSTIPPSFTARKNQILSELQRPDADYTDKSPKGSVDVQIRDLIDEINQLEGYVTTSSCAGRVAVFVEGGNLKDNGPSGETEGQLETNTVVNTGQEAQKELSNVNVTKTSPGGKGGGRWLYVSHDPIPAAKADLLSSAASSDGCKQLPGKVLTEQHSQLFNLPPSRTTPNPAANDHSAVGPTHQPRLIHLTFSPLILHIHCASLSHARPFLSAAINAGFRESGIQSLRILNEPESGVMLAIRTAGLAFETVVGILEGDDARTIVSEEYLQLCVDVVNERFKWNDERRERLRAEMRKVAEKQRGENEWEDKEERRRRKRKEGLLRQTQKDLKLKAKRL